MQNSEEPCRQRGTGSVRGLQPGLQQQMLFAGHCRWEPGLPLVTLAGDGVRLPRPLSIGRGQRGGSQDPQVDAGWPDPPRASVHGDAQADSVLPPQIIDLTTELSDERYKGDVACQVLDGERAERLRGARELQELQVGDPRAVGPCRWPRSRHSLAGPECPGAG